MGSFFDSNLSNARSVEEKIRNLTEKIIKNPEDYFSYKEQARLLLNNNPNEGRAKIALGSLEKFLEKEPDDIESNCLVVRALRLQGNLDDALSRAERLKNKFQNTATIYEELGRIQYERGNYDAALEILSTSYTKYNDDRIGRALVLTLLKVKKIDQALSICNKLLDKKPNDVRTIYEKIKILAFTNKPKEALEVGSIFLDEFPDESNEIMYGDNDQPMTFEIQLASIYQFAGRKILREEKSQHLFLDKNDQNKFFVKNNLGPEAKSLFEKSLFHIDNSISDRSQYDWGNALAIKQESLVFLGKFRESLVLLDELLQNRHDFVLIRERIFVLFCLNRYDEVLKISEKYLEQLPTSKFIRKLKLSSLINLDKKTEYDNELKMMQEYRLKQNPQKPKQDIMSDYSINFSKNDVESGRAEIRKVEKDLRNFMRKNFTIEMMQEYDKHSGETTYNVLERRRLENANREHKSKGTDDVYSQMTIGDVEHIIVSQKKQAAKNRTKISKLDEKILEAQENELEDLKNRKADLLAKVNGNLNTVWDKFDKYVMRDLEWLRDNFRNPHDHTVEDINQEFEVYEIVQAKAFSHKVRKFIKKLESDEK
jgi:tetratricopeptide (TPR) repeat protein